MERHDLPQNHAFFTWLTFLLLFLLDDALQFLHLCIDHDKTSLHLVNGVIHRVHLLLLRLIHLQFFGQACCQGLHVVSLDGIGVCHLEHLQHGLDVTLLLVGIWLGLPYLRS